MRSLVLISGVCLVMLGIVLLLVGAERPSECTGGEIDQVRAELAWLKKQCTEQIEDEEAIRDQERFVCDKRVENVLRICEDACDFK